MDSHDKSGRDRVGEANLGVIETKNVGPKYFSIEYCKLAFIF